MSHTDCRGHYLHGRVEEQGHSQVEQLLKLPPEISCGDVVTCNPFLPNMFVLEEILSGLLCLITTVTLNKGCQSYLPLMQLFQGGVFQSWTSLCSHSTLWEFYQ